MLLLPGSFPYPVHHQARIIIGGPLLVGQWMVRSHPEWVGRDGELWLVAFGFVYMGRYGVLLLNMLLGILIFYVLGGYTLLLIFGLAGPRAYIYVFDHLSVIKTIPKCVYFTLGVDWWAQRILTYYSIALVHGCFMMCCLWHASAKWSHVSAKLLLRSKRWPDLQCSIGRTPLQMVLRESGPRLTT